jgi:hypothetical protein
MRGLVDFMVKVKGGCRESKRRVTLMPDYFRKRSRIHNTISTTFDIAVSLGSSIGAV